MLANRGYAQPLDIHLAEEAQAFGRCAVTRDFAVGVTAFIQKRNPRFRGQ
jgi:2-(1,2-epoxy-1,2-dihydrophenyl)acetyl-CoA isomerase